MADIKLVNGWGRLWPEAAELMAQHKRELGQDDPRRVLTPDHQAIRGLEEAGALLALGAVADGVLVGYLIFYLVPSLETLGLLVGQQGPWFVLERWRREGVGQMLWREAKRQLSERGVRLLACHSAPGSGLRKLFQREGGRQVEEGWEIWLQSRES